MGAPSGDGTDCRDSRSFHVLFLLGPDFTRDQPQHQTDDTAREGPRPGGTKHHSAATGAAAQPAEQRTCYGTTTYEHNNL